MSENEVNNDKLKKAIKALYENENDDDIYNGLNLIIDDLLKKESKLIIPLVDDMGEYVRDQNSLPEEVYLSYVENNDGEQYIASYTDWNEFYGSTGEQDTVVANIVQMDYIYEALINNPDFAGLIINPFSPFCYKVPTEVIRQYVDIPVDIVREKTEIETIVPEDFPERTRDAIFQYPDLYMKIKRLWLVKEVQEGVEPDTYDLIVQFKDGANAKVEMDNFMYYIGEVMPSYLNLSVVLYGYKEADELLKDDEFGLLYED